MSRTELRCDARRRELVHSDACALVKARGNLACDCDALSAPAEGKCGKLLARSPVLGERVQWSTISGEWCGEVWLIDHDRHLATVRVKSRDGIEYTSGDAGDQIVGWTALRPCNGSPVR